MTSYYRPPFADYLEPKAPPASPAVNVVQLRAIAHHLRNDRPVWSATLTALADQAES